MSNEKNITDQSVADVSAALQQQRPDLDPAFRDRLIFAAGRAARSSAPRPPIAWIVATILFAGTSLLLGVSWWVEAGVRSATPVAAPDQSRGASPGNADRPRVSRDSVARTRVVVEDDTSRDADHGILRVSDRSLDRLTASDKARQQREDSDSPRREDTSSPARRVIRISTDLDELWNTI